MSGHSKWAQIKRQKAGNDAKRGQLFTKLAREITVAAREGGGDPDANVRLRLAIQRARTYNLPQDNIERAIKRATGGQGEGERLDSAVYEGYGPGGAAIMIEALTDNRNRAVAEVRSVFARTGGNLGETGSVAWLFDPRGVISMPLDGRDADEASLAAIDAGADDVTVDGNTLDVYTAPGDLEAVRRALEAQQLPIETAEVTYVPKTYVQLDPKQVEQVLRLIDRLEDLDDVQRVHTNLDPSQALSEVQLAAS